MRLVRRVQEMGTAVRKDRPPQVGRPLGPEVQCEPRLGMPRPGCFGHEHDHGSRASRKDAHPDHRQAGFDRGPRRPRDLARPASPATEGDGNLPHSQGRIGQGPSDELHRPAIAGLVQPQAAQRVGPDRLGRWEIVDRPPCAPGYDPGDEGVAQPSVPRHCPALDASRKPTSERDIRGVERIHEFAHLGPIARPVTVEEHDRLVWVRLLGHRSRATGQTGTPIAPSGFLYDDRAGFRGPLACSIAGSTVDHEHAAGSRDS